MINWILGRMKLIVFKNYDIIHREQAPFFVEFDNTKIEQALDILRKRKDKIQYLPKMPKETRQTLMNLIDDILLVGKYFGSSNMLKLRDVPVMTKEQLEEEKEEQDTINDMTEIMCDDCNGKGEVERGYKYERLLKKLRENNEKS